MRCWHCGEEIYKREIEGHEIWFHKNRGIMECVQTYATPNEDWGK